MRIAMVNIATAMLVIGYLIHAGNFLILGQVKMMQAMMLFAAAMYFLFV